MSAPPNAIGQLLAEPAVTPGCVHETVGIFRVCSDAPRHASWLKQLRAHPSTGVGAAFGQRSKQLEGARARSGSLARMFHKLRLRPPNAHRGAICSLESASRAVQYVGADLQSADRTTARV